MTAWEITGIVAVAGALGGVIAALMSEDKGFLLPTKVQDATGTIIRPGFLGLMIIGAAAAALSFALYGPLSNTTAFGSDHSGLPRQDYGITLAALGGAVLVGIGGSKWISSQVDKALLSQAAGTAAGKVKNAVVGTEIAQARPTEALKLAKAMPA